MLYRTKCNDTVTESLVLLYKLCRVFFPLPNITGPLYLYCVLMGDINNLTLKKTKA